VSETDRVDGEGREGSLERVPPRLGGGDAVEEEHRAGAMRDAVRC